MQISALLDEVQIRLIPREQLMAAVADVEPVLPHRTSCSFKDIVACNGDMHGKNRANDSQDIFLMHSRLL